MSNLGPGDAFALDVHYNDRMVITNHYVYRTARFYVELHGDKAVQKARERVAYLQARGDLIGADIWLCTIDALEEMRKPVAARG